MNTQPVLAAEADLSVYMLGRFAVWRAGRPIPPDRWRLRKAQRLVTLLALAPHHCMARDQLMDRLWPELAPQAAANNLHKAIHVARHVVEPEAAVPARLLYLRPTELALAPGACVWTDVGAFRSAAAAALEAEEPRLCSAALALYGGDLLPEDRYEDWTIADREELHELWVVLSLHLASLWEARGALAGALTTLWAVVQDDPLHESATASLMRLLARAGHRSLALRQYHKLRTILQRELNVAPAPDVRQLYEKLCAGLTPGTVPTLPQPPRTSTS
jgi:DNA-binding SARP family transcriptional activator